MKKPESQFDALVTALELAVTAPTEEKAQQCVEIAENLATGLSEIDVERAKKAAKKLDWTQQAEQSLEEKASREHKDDMSDDEMFGLVTSLTDQVSRERRLEIATLLIAGTLDPDHAEQTAGFMAGHADLIRDAREETEE